MNPYPDSGPPPDPSSHAFDVVAAALHRALACMEEACPKQAEAARLIRVGSLQEAFPLISHTVSLWQEVQSSLAAAGKAIGQPVERLTVLLFSITPAPNAPASADPLAELASLLETLKRSVQARDWIGLADALEYDLVDLAQRWRSALIQPDETQQVAA